MSLFLKQYLTENISKILSWSEYSCKVLNLQTIVDWYLEPRQCTTFRVNTLRYNTEDLITNITEELKKKFNLDTNDLPSVTVNEIIPECITIGRLQESILDLTPSSKEVIVDVYCGAAVLRGSNVFAPGVMGMLPSISIGEKVSIYVDLSGKCLQGYKEIYNAEEKLFVGNGIALMNRSQLFGVAKQKRGVAIAVTNPSSGVVMFDHLFSMGILQNLPSMVCVRALDPKPDEVILDMCAAPGNKTTHIATLANDEATIVAIDRAVKIGTIIQNCINLSIQNVLAFKGDSTKLITEENDRRIQNGPPFSKNTFDKILADVPCSGSGQRPMLKILIKRESDIRSYAPLQKKFLRNAIYLLKPGGYIVYSTCSIYCEENECVIAWLLETYPEMELVSSAPLLGVPGLPECGLNEEQRQLVQRFGPGKKTAYDTIGFFIAKLRKTRDIEEPVWRK